MHKNGEESRCVSWTNTEFHTLLWQTNFWFDLLFEYYFMKVILFHGISSQSQLKFMYASCVHFINIIGDY